MYNEQLVNSRKRTFEKISSGYRKIVTGVGLVGCGLVLMMPQLIMYDGFTFQLVENTFPELTKFLGSLLSVGSIGTGFVTSIVGKCQINKNNKILETLEEEEIVAFRTLENEKENLNIEKGALLGVIERLKMRQKFETFQSQDTSLDKTMFVLPERTQKFYDAINMPDEDNSICCEDSDIINDPRLIRR